MYITMSEIGNSHSTNSSPSQSNTGFSRRLFARMNELTGVARVEVLAYVRERRVQRARHAVMLSLRKRGWSTPQIGALLSRDHTTVISGIKTARLKYDNDESFRTLVDSLCA